ncbi:MAG: bifunctional DNA-formamidopyrimidine glycosylase/DNA-(apurinic or apyrimidinic site) lyase [Pseudomonadota bacterium]
MPELPEVETVRAGLLPAMEGQTISKTDVNRPDLRWPFPDRMSERLSDVCVLALRRRSKYLLADLSSQETLLIHLGMSGRILVSGDPLGQFHREHPAPEKHDHVVFHMRSGARVTFNDPRRFGAMDLIPTAELGQHKLLRELGPEPLGNAFYADYLYMRLKERRTPIKSALLDQKLVSGLGNIYVCEALYRAGISPIRRSDRVARHRVELLASRIRDVLRDAIAAGGSSLRDYRTTGGDLGYFQHRFSVYDREGQRCQTPDCSGIISRVVQSGRSSFYCSTCQR